MAQETALQVIELQQLPIIVERLHSVKADIEQRTADALSLVCTEQTYKSVKDARAQLTSALLSRKKSLNRIPSLKRFIVSV